MKNPKLPRNLNSAVRANFDVPFSIPSGRDDTSEALARLAPRSSTNHPDWPLVRIGGTLVEVGALFPVLALPLTPEKLVRHQWTLRGIHNYAPRHLAQGVALLAETFQQFPFEQLVNRWYTLDEAPAALQHAAPLPRIEEQ